MTFIIAECGINHGGDFTNAVAQIGYAKHAGANAVKFQLYKAEEQIYSGMDPQLRAVLHRCEFTPDDIKRLSYIAATIGIEFICTPFSREYAEFLGRLDVTRFKIGSGQITKSMLLQQVDCFEKPVILSTGMGTEADIRAALIDLKRCDVTLLYCISKYPTPDHLVSIEDMIDLGQRYEKPVGFSDHTAGIWASVAAAARGATVIEKHFTTSRDLGGPDQCCSLEPHEFAHMVHEIRAL